jgi:DNA primase
MFDMLNLYDKGLENVVCCFGTNTLQNNTKQKLLPFKAQGVTHIYLMFDGDEAGQKAAKILKPLIEDCEFVVEIIDLPDGTDPGELSQEDVDATAEYITK